MSLVVPENFRRNTPEETIAVLLQSHREATQKIGAQGRDLSELNRLVAAVEAEIPQGFRRQSLVESVEALAVAVAASNQKVRELAERVAEYESRDKQVALLAALSSQEASA